MEQILPNQDVDNRTNSIFFSNVDFWRETVLFFPTAQQLLFAQDRGRKQGL